MHTLYTRCRSHTIKDTLTPHKHRRRMTAASELGKHEKRVVVQHCWLTCDRKAAPRPPSPGHPRRSQYLWTLKMGASRIHLEERRRICEAEHDELETSSPGKPLLTTKNTKILYGSRSPLRQGDLGYSNKEIEARPLSPWLARAVGPAGRAFGKIHAPWS